MNILSSAWFENPPKSVEKLLWTSMNFRSNLRWITIGKHLNSFYRYLLCNDLSLIFFSPQVHYSVLRLAIRISGSSVHKSGRKWALPLLFVIVVHQTRFQLFSLSQITSPFLQLRFIPGTNPHLPLFPLLSWCLDTTHTYDKIVPSLVQVHWRPAQCDLKRLEIIPSSICLAITFLLATSIWGKLSLSQTLMWLTSVCTLGTLLKKRLLYSVVIHLFLFCDAISHILCTLFMHAEQFLGSLANTRTPSH